MNTSLTRVGTVDLDLCVEILRGGLAFQREQGFVQWKDGYPNVDEVRHELDSGHGFVFMHGGIPAGFVCLSLNGEPVYDDINGAWTTPEPYMVIHRLAFARVFLGTGLSREAFPLMEEHGRSIGAKSSRIDTHADNHRMLHIIARQGYTPAGTVVYSGGRGERLAFEKAL